MLLVHAKSEEAKVFYENRGCRSSPINPMTLMITLEDARRVVAAKGLIASSPRQTGSEG